MEKILKFEMKVSGTAEEIEDIKARIATLTIFEVVKSLYIKQLK